MDNKCPFSHLHEPRGPKGLPIIHSFLDTAVNVLQFLTTTREKYGDIAKYKIFGITHYLVSHPDDIAQVYKEETMPIRLPPKTSISCIILQVLSYVCAALWSIGRKRNFLSIILGSNRIGMEETKGAFSKKRFHEVLYPFFGNGLFNSQGKDWERQRKQIQPFFHKSKIPNWFPLVVEETQNHFKSIKPQASELHATELMQATVQSIMSRILFGLKLDNEDSKAAVAAIEGVSERMADHGLKSFIFNGILNKLPTPANLKFKRQLQTIDYSIRKISENNDAKDGLPF